MNIDLDSISQGMPDFEDHEAARQWFKDQLQDRFSLKNIEDTDGKKVYYYHIIKNQERYQQYMESFAKPIKHEITEMDTLKSYSAVEITEDGEITFIL